MDERTKIVVRNRRKSWGFSIMDNVIMDDWIPILGPVGFTLYSIYNKMSNEEGKAFPGYQLLESFIGISPGTVANYNRVLAWAKLIYIEPGDAAANTPNVYWVLDEVPVTYEAISHIRHEAIDHYRPNDPFLNALLKRLENWRPLTSYYRQKLSTVDVVQAPPKVKPTQAEKRPTQEEKKATQEEKYPTQEEKKATQEEKYPTSVLGVEQKPVPKTTKTTAKKTKRNNQPTKQAGWLAGSIFRRLGIEEPTLSELATTPDDLALAMTWWCISQNWAEKPAGLAIRRIQQGKQPPAGFLELAERLIADDLDTFQLKQAIAIGRSDYEIDQKLSLSPGAAAAARAIYKMDTSWLSRDILEVN